MHRIWPSPTPNIKTENEFPPQLAVSGNSTVSWNTIKIQVDMKTLTRKSKKERILDKTVSFAERLNLRP